MGIYYGAIAFVVIVGGAVIILGIVGLVQFLIRQRKWRRMDDG